MRSDSHPVHGDPRLSRFDPMERVIYFDDFDQGMNGWTCLVGNYQDSLDTMTTSYARHTQPMLSQITHWDSGTHGSFDGTYALKIATRPVAGERNTAIKRVTFRKATRIRVETYFACKPEANELKLSDKDVRTFGVLFDLQDRQQRVMPHLRYLNTLNGERRHQWQFKQRTTPFRAIGGSDIVTHDHLSPEDWEDVPGGHQNLCYNEIPTKINWHYLRFDFDLVNMCWLGFQCNDLVMDPSGLESIKMPAMANLDCMLNLAFFAKATPPSELSFIWTACFCREIFNVATLRNTYTAVIARGERWTGQVYTEPYEAAWASEAVFFIHLMPDSTPPSGTAVARVQISPDGLHWVNEGTEFELPTVPDAVTFGRVLNFGGWLRLAVAVPNSCVFKVVATLSLKA